MSFSYQRYLAPFVLVAVFLELRITFSGIRPFAAALDEVAR